MSENYSLFDEKKNINYLNVIKDMQKTEMSVEDIFDTKVYGELLAVTFVASPNFFFKVTKGFETIKLIMGIQDGNVAANFMDGFDQLLNPKKKIDFWNQLDTDIQEKIRKENYFIRYGKPGAAIHSKIYLLKGDSTTRLVLGSANFTEMAFANKKQYEEVVITDNSPLYETYLERFNELYQNTFDFIPEYLKKKQNADILLINDPEIMTNVLMTELEKSRSKICVTEAVMEEIKTVVDKYSEQSHEAEKIIEIIEIVTKKESKTGQYKLRPVAELQKKVAGIKTLVSNLHKKSQELDIRSPFIYRPQDNMLYMRAEETNVDQELILLSQKITDKGILTKKLLLIDRFVQAYNEFTDNKDTDNQSRIFETILFGFSAPYIWKIREHYAREEGQDSMRSTFPPFLIVGGRALSGKTTVLEFVSKLIGNASSYFDYEKIKSQIISDYFNSSNVSPILVDEIAHSFFSSSASYLGERLVKSISNDLTGRHPVMIGTTNAREFSMNNQMVRRIYYLQVNNTFNDLVGSKKYLNEIYAEVDNTLFRDFSFRIAELINSGKEFYTVEDPLFAARQIFKMYYSECGIDVPEYFPEKIFDDYNVRGRFIWAELFKRKKEFFDTESDEGSIYVDIDKFSNDFKDKIKKINMLPANCIIEDSNILVLNKKAFYDFTSTDEKADTSIFKKIFRWLAK